MANERFRKYENNGDRSMSFEWPPFPKANHRESGFTISVLLGSSRTCISLWNVLYFHNTRILKRRRVVSKPNCWAVKRTEKRRTVMKQITGRFEQYSTLNSIHSMSAFCGRNPMCCMSQTLTALVIPTSKMYSADNPRNIMGGGGGGGYWQWPYSLYSTMNIINVSRGPDLYLYKA